MVVRDVLNSEQCLATIDDMWSYIETKEFIWNKRDERIINPIKRDDQDTWNNGWPPGQTAGLVSSVREIWLN